MSHYSNDELHGFAGPGGPHYITRSLHYIITHYSSSLHSWGEVEHDGVLPAHEDHGVSPHVPHQCSGRHGLASIVIVIHWDNSWDHSGAPNDNLGDGVGFERCYGRHPVVIVTQCNASLHQYILGPHYITITLL